MDTFCCNNVYTTSAAYWLGPTHLAVTVQRVSISHFPAGKDLTALVSTTNRRRRHRLLLRCHRRHTYCKSVISAT